MKERSFHSQGHRRVHRYKDEINPTKLSATTQGKASITLTHRKHISGFEDDLYSVGFPSIWGVQVSMETKIQQSLPSADPLTGGHLPWADIFPMYELLSNLIQPLMNGHLLNGQGQCLKGHCPSFQRTEDT